MTFGEYVRENGFTAKSLAEKADLSVRSVEGYTTGRFPLKNARLWFAVRIAKALEISPEKLIEFDQ